MMNNATALFPFPLQRRAPRGKRKKGEKLVVKIWIVKRGKKTKGRRRAVERGQGKKK